MGFRILHFADEETGSSERFSNQPGRSAAEACSKSSSEAKACLVFISHAILPLAARHPVLSVPRYLARQQCQCWVAATALRVSLRSPFSCCSELQLAWTFTVRGLWLCSVNRSRMSGCSLCLAGWLKPIRIQSPSQIPDPIFLYVVPLSW